ncbi:hypothetical protein IW261DRAFT_1472160 [Armillaria novae-zelandiae]|uniref:GDP-mannose transporter n=1 Tax=Armillaria novae-zelandiae TaxID=153914 RepID=A0AA39PCI2_9AGAR|nr:hypothetical protein IW261DRAFT_1472160 [Armillaria novae-zelandiae]
MESARLTKVNHSCYIPGAVRSTGLSPRYVRAIEIQDLISVPQSRHLAAVLRHKIVPLSNSALLPAMASLPNASNLKVAAVVGFYMSAALVAVLNNSPDLPLLFLFIQLLIAVALLHITALASTKIQLPKLDLIVVSINIIGLVFNTLCLRDVEASFFQIARGLQLPLTILVSSVNTRSTPSRKVITAAVIVTGGFFLGVAPSKSVPVMAAPSLISLFYGFLSSLFIAFHAVLIKSSLPHCNNSTIELAWWTNVGSAIMLFPFVILNGEPWRLQELMQSSEWTGDVFMWGCVVTGVFGFLLCVAGLLSIKVTSPITHMFSSAARSVLQTILGVWIFSDLLTVNRASSILVILGGTMFYTWVKSTESAPRPAIPPQSQRQDVDLETLERGDRVPKDDEESVVLWQIPEKEEKASSS